MWVCRQIGVCAAVGVYLGSSVLWTDRQVDVCVDGSKVGLKTDLEWACSKPLCSLHPTPFHVLFSNPSPQLL